MGGGTQSFSAARKNAMLAIKPADVARRAKARSLEIRPRLPYVSTPLLDQGML